MKVGQTGGTSCDVGRPGTVNMKRRQTGETSCSVEWPGTVDMKVMKVGLGITYGVKMNCDVVSAGMMA